MSDSEQLKIDVSDEVSFKVGVVQGLQILMDRTECLSDLRTKVQKHEQIVQIGKYAAIPVIGLFQVSLKAMFHKLGWWN